MKGMKRIRLLTRFNLCYFNNHKSIYVIFHTHNLSKYGTYSMLDRVSNARIDFFGGFCRLLT